MAGWFEDKKSRKVPNFTRRWKSHNAFYFIYIIHEHTKMSIQIQRIAHRFWWIFHTKRAQPDCIHVYQPLSDDMPLVFAVMILVKRKGWILCPDTEKTSITAKTADGRGAISQCVCRMARRSTGLSMVRAGLLSKRKCWPRSKRSQRNRRPPATWR